MSVIRRQPDWYITPDRQIKRVRELLWRCGTNWEFTTDDIPLVPGFEAETGTELLTLDVNLGPQGSVKSLERTFKAGWACVQPPAGCIEHKWDGLLTDAGHLKVFDGIEESLGITEPTRGFRWVGLDPNANQNRSPYECWEDPEEAKKLAGTTVLNAANLFEGWVAGWNGTDSPYPNMAGLQFKFQTNWLTAPFLDLSSDKHLLRLCVVHARVRDIRYANPRVRELELVA